MPEQAPRTVEYQVVDYYQSYDERGRLTNGSGLLEFLRLKEIIQRFIEPPPGVVFDVEAGEYAAELDERLSDKVRREQLLGLIRRVENERTLLGMASHFVVIAQK